MIVSRCALVVSALCASLVFAEEHNLNVFTEAGMGAGVHYQPIRGPVLDKKQQELKTRLIKGDVTYEYRWNRKDEAAVYKKSKDGSDELIKFGRDGLPAILEWSFLIDVQESKGRVHLLMRHPHQYMYIELVDEYIVPDPPEGENYVVYQDRYSNSKWKPLNYVSFVPEGMFKLLTGYDRAGLKSISLDEIGVFVVAFEAGVSDRYVFKDGWLTRNGENFEKTNFTYKKLLESEFFKKCTEMSDESLMISLDISKSLDEKGDVAGDMQKILDAIKDKESANSLRNRIKKVQAAKAMQKK